MANKYGRPRALEQGFKNVFMLIMYVVTIFGLYMGWRYGLDASDLYLTLTLVAVSLIVIILLWVNETSRKFRRAFLITPFSISPKLSMATWLLGWATIPVLNFIGQVLFPMFSNISFTTTQFFQSLFYSASGGAETVAQTFSVAQLQNAPFVVWFYSVWVAGTIEEFVWAFVLPVVFHTIAIGIVNQFLDGEAPLGMQNENFYFLFSLFFSVITFMGIHTLNGSYVGIMFIIAGAFRFLMNTFVYLFGATASYVIGVHQSNNNTAFIQQFGIDVWLSAVFGNWWGILIVFGFFLPAIIITAINGRDIWQSFLSEIFYRNRGS